MMGDSFIQKQYRRVATRGGLQSQSLMGKWATRRFESQDFLPVPESYLVGPPDYVGIASGEAGSTWWYRLLLDHPATKPNRLACKELSYFYHFSYKGLDSEALSTYRKAFATPAGCVCGEWSPGYLSYPLAIDYLAQAAPDAKLLAIIRNPVDRYFSALNHQVHVPVRHMNLEQRRAYVNRTIPLITEIMSSSLYALAFRHLLQLFDRSQLLLLQYEQCRRNPAVQIASTYRFLNMGDSYIPDSLDQRVNEKPYAAPDIEPHDRAVLVDYFSDDVRSLVEIFPEIDLSLWPDFKNLERHESALNEVS